MTAPSTPHAAAAEQTPELRAYYADTRRLVWNMVWIQLGSLGHSVCFLIVGTLMLLHLKASGVNERTIAVMNSLNGFTVSFLVMYFSYRSDRTVSRWGRRIPYLLLSAPFIIVSVALFPFLHHPASLIILFLVQALFMDMKLCTYPLLSVDCLPRNILGRMSAMTAVLNGLAGFLVMRYGMRVADAYPTLPFLLGAGLLAFVTLAAAFGIREPPIRVPASAPFRPWSTFAVGWKDRRMMVLMCGVAIVHSFMVQWRDWHVFWVTNTEGAGLGLSKTIYGEALSWAQWVPVVLAMPIGWLIDKVSGYRIVTVLVLLQIGAFAFAMTQVRDAHTLMIMGLMMTAMGPLYGAADLMVYRNAPAADIGSMIATNACVRQVLIACIGLVAGQAIIANGGLPDYRHAFILGITLSVGGLLCFVLHHRLQQGRKASLQPCLPTPAAVV
jgi:Na+/melibiose symporter-like transporter